MVEPDTPPYQASSSREPAPPSTREILLELQKTQALILAQQVALAEQLRVHVDQSQDIKKEVEKLRHEVDNLMLM